MEPNIQDTTKETSMPTTSSVSADLLFSTDKEVLDRADALLAKGSMKSVEMKAPSVRIAHTQQQRRDLVHKHLHYKWSTLSSQAAIIKTGNRPVVVARFTETSDLLPKDELGTYSGWCPVCREGKEWCGFIHESMGRNRVQATTSKTSAYEQKVKRKARLRRGNAVGDTWRNGETRRLAAQAYHVKVCLRKEKANISEDEESLEIEEENLVHVDNLKEENLEEKEEKEKGEGRK